jgi:hypothetical protein
VVEIRDPVARTLDPDLVFFQAAESAEYDFPADFRGVFGGGEQRFNLFQTDGLLTLYGSMVLIDKTSYHSCSL